MRTFGRVMWIVLVVAVLVACRREQTDMERMLGIPQEPLSTAILRGVMAFVVGTGIRSLCIWGGMKVATVEGTYKQALVMAAVGTALSFIPWVGWVLGAAAICAMLVVWCEATFWPEAVLVVVVQWAIAFGVHLVFAAGRV